MMSFGTAISTCMRKFVTFSGRAPRAEYWWFILFTIIVSLVLQFVHPIAALIVSLVLFIPTLAVTWRRFHDVNKSGLWYFATFLTLIPAGVYYATQAVIFLYIAMAVCVVIGLYLLFLMIKRGDVGANRFGNDPYGPSHDASVFE